MVKSEPIRRVFVYLSLLSLVLLATVFGGALHYHESSDSSNSCPICHLNHQPIERSMASDPLPALLPAGPGPEPLGYEFAATPMTQRVPSRAPPSA